MFITHVPMERIGSLNDLNLEYAKLDNEHLHIKSKNLQQMIINNYLV